MPIKTYKCAKCEHEFEYFERGEDMVEACPECEAPREYLDPVWNLNIPAPASYKGSGFFTTDYNKGKRAGDK